MTHRVLMEFCEAQHQVLRISEVKNFHTPLAKYTMLMVTCCNWIQSVVYRQDLTLKPLAAPSYVIVHPIICFIGVVC